MIKGIWPLCFLISPVKQKVIAGQFHVPSHPGVLKKINIKGNLLQRYFSLKKF